MVYTSAVSLDPIEKKPLYHYHPGTKTLSIGTVGCNLQCLNCQNHHIARPVDSKLVHTKVYSPEELVSMARYKKVRSISWTYNEPTIHPSWIIKTSKIAKEHDIKTILVTNGYNSQKTLDELIDYVDCVNVDIKSMNDDFYKKVCHGSLKPVLNSVKYYYENNKHVEITNLLIPGYNTDTEDIRNLINFIQEMSNYIPLHFTRFYPQYKLSDVDPTPVKIIKKACDLAKYMGIKYVYPGNIEASYLDNTYCRNCKHLLIKRENYNTELMLTDKYACPNCNHKSDIIF